MFSLAESGAGKLLETPVGRDFVDALVQRFPKATNALMKKPQFKDGKPANRLAKIEKELYKELAKEGADVNNFSALEKAAVRHAARYVDRNPYRDIVTRRSKPSAKVLTEGKQVFSEVPPVGTMKELPERGYFEPERVSVKPDTSIAPRGKFLRTENGIVYPDGRKIITPITEAVKADMASSSRIRLTEKLAKDAANGVKGARAKLNRFVKKNPDTADLAESVGYDVLVEKANAGDQSAVDRLNSVTQGLDKPTYEQLLTKANKGDQSAIDAIQSGDYRKPRINPLTGKPVEPLTKEQLAEVEGKVQAKPTEAVTPVIESKASTTEDEGVVGGGQEVKPLESKQEAVGKVEGKLKGTPTQTFLEPAEKIDVPRNDIASKETPLVDVLGNEFYKRDGFWIWRNPNIEEGTAFAGFTRASPDFNQKTEKWFQQAQTTPTEQEAAKIGKPTKAEKAQELIDKGVTVTETEEEIQDAIADKKRES